MDTQLAAIYAIIMIGILVLVAYLLKMISSMNHKLDSMEEKLENIK
jgi:uncharacterized protein YoxC